MSDFSYVELVTLNFSLTVLIDRLEEMKKETVYERELRGKVRILINEIKEREGYKNE